MTLIILMYALWACAMPISKYLLGYSTPLFLAGSRFLIGGLFLLGYQLFYTREDFNFKKKHWVYFAQIILLGICTTYVLRYWGLRDLPAFKTCFLYNLSPFMASFYSYLMFKERITKRQWTGLIIGFIGLIPMLISSSPGEAAIGEFMYISWQELAVLTSIATHSYSWIVMRKLVRFKKYSPMTVNAINMTLGGLILLATSFSYELWYQGLKPVNDIKEFATWLTILIVLSNVLCHNMYGHLLKKYTATFLAFAGFMGPLFTALYGWAFLHEIITWHFYLSSVIVFFGLLLFYKDEISQQAKMEPTL